MNEILLLGHFAPLSFTAFGGKIQATLYAGGRCPMELKNHLYLI